MADTEHAVFEAEQQQPATEVAVKRGPGRPRKTPLLAPTPSPVNSTRTSSAASLSSLEAYELQKMLLKQKMKKYAKQYIQKEHQKNIDRYYYASQTGAASKPVPQAVSDDGYDDDDVLTSSGEEQSVQEDRYRSQQQQYKKVAFSNTQPSVLKTHQTPHPGSKLAQILGHRR